MSLPKMAEIENLTKTDLESEILNIRKQLFKLRFCRANQQTFKSHQFKHQKHRLAQLLMKQQSS